MPMAEQKPCVLAIGGSSSLHVRIPAEMLRQAGYRVALADLEPTVWPGTESFFDAVYTLMEPVQRTLMGVRAKVLHAEPEHPVKEMQVEEPSRARPYYWRLMHGWLRAGQLRKIVAHEHPGVVHAQHFTLCAMTLYYWLKHAGFEREAKRPGVLGHLFSYKPRFPGIRRRENEVVKSCDYIHTSSEHVAKIYLENYDIAPDRMSVCVRGIDLGTFAPRSAEALDAARQAWGVPKGKFVLFHNRHLNPMYRVDIAVDAFIELARRGHDVFMLFARGSMWDKSYEDELLARLGAGGVAGRVALLPHILSADQMAIALQLSDCTINTVPYDAFAVSIFESMYCRAVPVVRDLPSYYRFVKEGETGFLCGGTGIDQYVEKIERLIRDPTLKQRLGEAGARLVAAEASVEHYRRNVLNLVERCWHDW
jgi:glycosyltransferase involved in cell wall biosynthesis